MTNKKCQNKLIRNIRSCCGASMKEARIIASYYKGGRVYPFSVVDGLVDRPQTIMVGIDFLREGATVTYKYKTKVFTVTDGRLDFEHVNQYK